MTPEPIRVDADAPLDAVAKLMLGERIHRVFVDREGAPVGVCSTRDIMRAVHDKRVTTPAIEIATTGAAGRAALIVAAVMPCEEITITARARTSPTSCAAASAMASPNGLISPSAAPRLETKSRPVCQW